MKIAIYSRKSKFTGKGDSIENQVEMCKSYIKANVAEPYEIVIYEDEGYSGSNIDRPEFKRCMQDIDKKMFDVLACYRLDRISRNVTDFSSIIDKLDRKHVRFVSVREQFDTSTPMGKAMMYIASVFAQLERETIADRIRDNMLQLARSGRWLGGITPTGFASEEITINDSQGKTRKLYMLKPIPSEIEIIKTIYQKFLDLKSLTQVETYLLQHHITTKNNTNFTRFTIKNILTNPVYSIADNDIFDYFNNNNYDVIPPETDFDGKSGVMAYNKTIQKNHQSNKQRDPSEWIIAIGKHEGIIPGAKWVKIQELLIQNKSKSFRKVRNQESLLSGVLRCAKCGSYLRPKMGRVLKNGSNMFYYLCELKEASKGVRCDCNNAPGPQLDKAVETILINYSADKSKVRNKIAEINVNLATQNDQIKEEINLITQKIKSNDSAISNLITTLSSYSNTAAAQYIVEEINALDKTNANLKDQLYKLSQKANCIEIESNKHELIDDLISNLSHAYETAQTIDEKRSIIKRVTDKITWDGENIDIVMIGADSPT